MRRAAHPDAERLARRRIGATHVGEHRVVELRAEVRPQPGVAVCQVDQDAVRGQTRQLAGTLDHAGVERLHVLQVVDPAQAGAVARIDGLPRLRPGWQALQRTERRHDSRRCAHPADRVVDQRIEGGHGELRRRLREDDNGKIDRRRAGRGIGHHHVDMAVADPMGHAARCREHRSRAVAEGGDLGAERRLGPVRGYKADRGRRTLRSQPHEARRPPQNRAGQPPQEPPGVARRADAQHPGADLPQPGAQVPKGRRNHRADDGSPAPARDPQRSGRNRYDVPEVAGGPSGPTRPMQCPGTRDGDHRAIVESRLRHHRRAQLAAQTVHQARRESRGGGNRNVKRGDRKLIEGGCRRTDPHARIGTEVLLDPLQPWVLSRHLDPHHQIVDAIGQDPLRRRDDALGRYMCRLDGDHVLGDREAAARPRVAEVLVCYQVGDLQSLDAQQALLRLPVRRPAPLVPCERLPYRDQHRPKGVNAIPELRILRSPTRERLVEPAGGLMELAADAEVP